MDDRRTAVRVHSAPGSAFGAALVAGLREHGFATEPASQPARGHWAVVLLEHDDGRPWVPVRPPRPERAIGVGSLRSAVALAALAARGAVVVDQDVPFLTLLRLVEDVLRSELAPPSPEQRLLRAARVRSRAAEARALEGLTEREREVLAGLVEGRTAAAIAHEGGRSLATVRSQIQSLTTRLGASGQLTAVAMAHRSGHATRIAARLDELHQF